MCVNACMSVCVSKYAERYVRSAQEGAEEQAMGGVREGKRDRLAVRGGEEIAYKWYRRAGLATLCRITAVDQLAPC